MIWSVSNIDDHWGLTCGRSLCKCLQKTAEGSCAHFMMILFLILSLDTCPLLIARATTFWWPPCWTVPLWWTLHSFWLVGLYSWLATCSVVSKYQTLLFCLVVLAGNESCPQPQTSEHLAAIEIMKLKHILILQNKIDLVKESQAKEQYEQILAFVQGKFPISHWWEVHLLISLFKKKCNPFKSFETVVNWRSEKNQ